MAIEDGRYTGLLVDYGGVLTTSNVLTASLQPETWYSLIDAAVAPAPLRAH